MKQIAVVSLLLIIIACSRKSDRDHEAKGDFKPGTPLSEQPVPGTTFRASDRSPSPSSQTNPPSHLPASTTPEVAQSSVAIRPSDTKSPDRERTERPEPRSYREHSQAVAPRSEFGRYGMHIEIPDNWEAPAAVIGGGVPKMQDGDRTVSPTLHEVYLSPKHGEDRAEIELLLFDVDARAWLNAMVIQPEKWLPARGDVLLTYSLPGDPDNDNVTGALLPFGNASAVKFRISRVQRGLRGETTLMTEDLFYCSCGSWLLQIQMRCDAGYFTTLEASEFKKFMDQFHCSRSME